ncbi:hypothetical protein [Streptomyces sp. NPDC101181]|uniref:hypothetical protein n=1 Tax=Streptomyces sp. NPDC101181 TaxID=3366125 RepID=UPI003805CCBD
MDVEMELASAQDMRNFLVDQLNSVLRRPGTYGDVEVCAWMTIDHLLFLEQRPDATGEQKHAWGEAGLWPADGVRGAISRLLPPDHQLSVASVYAEFARRQGWLKADRVVDAGTYASMRITAGAWAQHDREWVDVTTAFGPPSVLFGGTNPH